MTRSVTKKNVAKSVRANLKKGKRTVVKAEGTVPCTLFLLGPLARRFAEFVIPHACPSPICRGTSGLRKKEGVKCLGLESSDLPREIFPDVKGEG